MRTVGTQKKRFFEVLGILLIVACGAFFLAPQPEPELDEATRQQIEAKADEVIEKSKAVAGDIMTGVVFGLSEALAPPVLTKEQEILQSIRYLNLVISKDPQNVGALLYRAQQYRRLGDTGKAVADLNTALDLKPDDSGLLNNRGYYLAEEGLFEAALVDAQRAVELDANANNLDTLGFVYVGLGRYQEAVQVYDRALEMEPDHLYARWGRGVALKELGQGQSARADFQRVVKASPDFCLHWEVADDPGHHGKSQPGTPRIPQ